MPNLLGSWGMKLSDIADAVWTRTLREITNVAAISDAVWNATIRRPTDAVEGIIIPSENLLVAADNIASTGSLGYTLAKQVTVKQVGTYRVKFALYVSSSGSYAYGRIYKNGVPVGTERITNSTTPITYSEDISCNVGDRIEVWIHVANSGYTAYCKNFRIYGDRILADETNYLPIVNAN